MQTKEKKFKRIHDTYMLLMRISKRWFVQRLQSFGLTLPQFITLAALVAYRQPCSMSDLTSVAFHDAPTMTGVTDRLVKMKLVRRTRSETDRRVVLVEATSQGIELFDNIETTLMQEVSTVYEELTDQELDTLDQLLRKLLRVHLIQTRSLTLLDEAEVDAELEKLELFVRDPIHYVKTENGKVI